MYSHLQGFVRILTCKYIFTYIYIYKHICSIIYSSVDFETFVHTHKSGTSMSISEYIHLYASGRTCTSGGHESSLYAAPLLRGLGVNLNHQKPGGRRAD